MFDLKKMDVPLLLGFNPGVFCQGLPSCLSYFNFHSRDSAGQHSLWYKKTGRMMLLYISPSSLDGILRSKTTPMNFRHLAQMADLPPDSCITDPRYPNFSDIKAGS